MGNSRVPGVVGVEVYDAFCPALSPGPLGMNDGADPTATALAGDRPGSVGLNDAAAETGSNPTLALPRIASTTLTPLEFEEIYHTLEVPCLDEATGVSAAVPANIHLYANNSLSDRQSNLGEKDRLVGLIRSELQRLRGFASGLVSAEHDLMVAHAFFAKGSPAECIVACFHALRHGLTTPGDLQNWIDHTARIGLDCSGFVNNYFVATGRLTDHQTVSAYGRGTRRGTAAEVQDLDVLVWEYNSHIAVIDHVIAGSDPRRMVVVESSGSKSGLANSEYTILNVERGVFQVDRGSDGSGQESRSRVRIVAPPGAG